MLEPEAQPRPEVTPSKFTPSQFTRPPTVYEAVLLDLRARLVDGRLRPGDAIRPEAIGEELGVSRVPVAEALKVLEGERQVQYISRRGYLVTRLTLAEMIEVFEIRELLENEAIARAVPRITPTDLDRMNQALTELLELPSDDLASMSAANRRFHFTLHAASGMPRLLHHIRLLWDTFEPYRSLYYLDAENRQRVDKEHSAILEAVAQKDVAKTLTKTRRHRSSALAWLKRVMKDD